MFYEEMYSTVCSTSRTHTMFFGEKMSVNWSFQEGSTDTLVCCFFQVQTSRVKVLSWSPKTQITNLPQGALQYMKPTIPRLSIWITYNSKIMGGKGRSMLHYKIQSFGASFSNKLLTRYDCDWWSDSWDQGFNWARLCFPPLTRGYERMTGRTGVVSASQGLCDYTSAGPLPCYTTGRIGAANGLKQDRVD